MRAEMLGYPMVAVENAQAIGKPYRNRRLFEYAILHHL
jgi:hypothetical protein